MSWRDLPLRSGSVVLVAGLGVLASLGVFNLSRGWHRARLEAEFKRLAEARVEVLRRRIDANLEILQSLRHLYMASQAVERHEFRAFTQGILARHPELLALAWVPRVPFAERAVFEETARQEGFPDFRISEQGPDGRMVPAAVREEYFPAYYIEPLVEPHRRVLGFDLGSDAVRRLALEESLKTDAPVATPWIELVTEEYGMGFLIVLPVHSNDQPDETPPDRPERVMGFLVAGYEVERFLSASLEGLDQEGVEIALSEESEGALGSRRPTPGPPRVRGGRAL